MKNVYWTSKAELNMAEQDEVEYSNITLKDVQNCFKDRKMVEVSDEEYYKEHTNHTGSLIRVLGITTNCFVYFGWLHEINTGTVNVRGKLPKGFENACKDFTPFVVRSENEGRKQLLFLAVKTYGRRLLVQSIASEHTLFRQTSNMTGGIVWMRMNPYARHEQFLTQEFPQDFTYDALLSLYYRVFIMGHSSSKTRILEMKVAIDRNGNLIPFITRYIINVNPIIHAPLFGTSFIANFDFRWGIGNSTKGHGFVFVRQLYEGSKPLRGKYIAVGVPIAALYENFLHATRLNMDYRGHIFNTGFITLYNTSSECSFLGHVRLSRQLAIKQWTKHTLLPAELELCKVTKRRFFNHFRFHRRMSYPHTIHRSQRHHVLWAWLKALPAILVNCILLVVIMYGVLKCISWHEIREARRSGISRSYSANTF